MITAVKHSHAEHLV